MRKLIIIAALVGTTCAQAFAQRSGHQEINPEQVAERMSNRMAEKLDLSEEQKKAVYALNLEAARKRQAQWEVRKKQQEAINAERKAHQEKIAGLLTPEQNKAWEAIMEDNRSRMREGRRGAGKRPGGRKSPGSGQL